MKKIVTLVSVMLLTSAVAALAVPSASVWFARGSYYDGGWSADANNNLFVTGTNTFARGVVSPNGAGYYEGKIALNDWSTSYPNSNQPVFLNSTGETVNWSLDENNYSDGWLPSTHIVMNDHGVPSGYTFEVIGAAPETGSWGSGVAAPLTGNIYSVQITIATAGTYDVKFRHTNDWSVNVGSDGFGTNSNNASYTTTTSNQPVLFQFNKATGRMRIVVGGVTASKGSTWGALKNLYR